MTNDSSAAGRRSLPEIDVSVPNSARIWNYWLGGKDNYPVDREAGDEFCEVFPGIIDMARASRYFLIRAVRHLAGEAQVRQFLDVGTGLPAVDNTHEVAQQVAPESRIVYVDNDPLVLAHARALVASTREGSTAYIEADLHDPGKILDGAAKSLDFNRPIALMLMGVMGYLPEDRAQPIVDRLMEGLPSGSYLVLYDGTTVSEALVEAQRRYNESGAVPYHLRSPERVARFFDGLDLLEPGVVSTSLWRPDPGVESPSGAESYGGVALKP